MDSNSKYANLPGIAHDQPDVYETNDLPEVDQLSGRGYRPSTLFDGDNSDNVDILKINPAEAYQRFEGHAVGGMDVDFSEASGIEGKRKGYQTWGEWEVGPRQGEKETPLQRYHRLQEEMNDLLEALKGVKEASVTGGAPAEGNPRFGQLTGDLTFGKVSSNLGALSSQLKELNIEQWAESDLLTGAAGNGNLFAEIETQMEGLIEEPHKIVQKKVPGSEEGALRQEPRDTMTYELLYKPEHSRANGLAKLNVLDQRIKRLETLLGNDENKISFLTSLTNEKTISEAVKVLSTRIAQLDSSHLEQMDGRLTSLVHKLNQLSEKKAFIEDAERLNKTSELYELMMKTDKYRSSLPLIASRLQSLAELQEQAVQFSGAISYLDSMQSQITESMSNNETDLKVLRETFAQNMDFLKTSLAEMDQRIEALK